jgi:cobalt/nickel transport system permease protein
MLILHLGVFHLDIDSKGETFWHKLTPPTRILCVLLLLLAIVLTPNGQWWSWLTYAVGIAVGLLLSRVTLLVLLKRLAVESAFVGVVLLGTLFRDGGEVLWQWGWLQITTTGLNILGSVISKACLSLVLLNWLTLTTSIPALLNALITLRVSPLLVAIIASMYRYLAVLLEEFEAMRRAALARNLMGNRRWHRLVVGNMIGSLFIRTYERGDRIYQAMLARGYQGVPPLQEKFKRGWRDGVALTLTGLFIIAGQIPYW